MVIHQITNKLAYIPFCVDFAGIQTEFHDEIGESGNSIGVDGSSPDSEVYQAEKNEDFGISDQG